MKRFVKLISALLIVTMLMSTFAMVAFAATKVKATGNCNIRSGPGLGYSSKGTFKKGKTATYQNSYHIDSRGVVWYKIKYNGKTGWVSAKYAKLGSGSVIYYDDDDDDYDYGDYVKTTASVHIRKSASRNASSLGTVSSGTYLVYRGKKSKDSRGVVWYAVKYKGKNGWVSSMYSYIY